MHSNYEPPFQLKRLRPRAPIPLANDAAKSAKRKAYLWIITLILELSVTLSICGLATILLAGGQGEAVFALLRAELEQDRLGESMPVREDVSTAPTVRVPATRSPTRPTATRALPKPIGNTGWSSTKPNASSTRTATLRPIPPGKAQIKATTPTITRAPTTTPTATATRIP